MDIFVYHGGICDGAGRGQRIKDFLQARNLEFSYYDGNQTRLHGIVTIPCVLVYKSVGTELVKLAEFTEQHPVDSPLDLVALGELLDNPPIAVHLHADVLSFKCGGIEKAVITLNTDMDIDVVPIVITDSTGYQVPVNVDITNRAGTFNLTANSPEMLVLSVSGNFICNHLLLEVL